MSPEQRAAEFALSLFVLLVVLSLAFFALLFKYEELETEHQKVHSAFEICDNERRQDHTP